MKNKLFSVCLVLAMFFLCLPVLPQANAADEWKTGYLSNLAVQPFIEEQVIARLYDTTGQYHDYKFAEYVRLTIETGGTKKYNRDAQGLYKALAAYKNTCCQFLLDADGTISQIRCSAETTTYKNVSYDTKTGAFSCDAATEGLPVYLSDGNTIGDASACLREGYTYTIQVGSYGVIITDFASGSYQYMPNQVIVDSSYWLNTDVQNIDGEVSFTCTGDADYQNLFLKVMLYDANGQLINERLGVRYSDGVYEFRFSRLENVTATYQVQGYLIKEGQQVSESFTKEVVIEQTVAKEGYFSNVAVQSFFEKQVIALLYDTNGQRQQYTFAERVVLINETNSKSYNNAQDLYDALTAYKNTCCRFSMDENGAISQIRCSAETTTYENVSYDTKTGAFSCDAATEGLPVYFMNDTGDAPSEKGILSDAYVYNITISPYGVLVNSMVEAEFDMPLDGEITDCRYEKGKVTATIAMNRCSEQSRILLVLYDARGAVACAAETQLLTPKTAFTMSVTAASSSVGCQVKVFFLSLQNGLVPVGMTASKIVES